jgi:hypothetical protein
MSERTSRDSVAGALGPTKSAQRSSLQPALPLPRGEQADLRQAAGARLGRIPPAPDVSLRRPSGTWFTENAAVQLPATGRAVAALARRARRVAGRTDVLCDRRPDTRQAVVECRSTERASSSCCSRRDSAPVRAAPATPRPCGRARARGSATEHHPAPARPRQPWHDLHLLAGNRHRGDHLGSELTASTDDAVCSRFALPKPTTCGASTRPPWFSSNSGVSLATLEPDPCGSARPRSRECRLGSSSCCAL